MYVEGLPYFDFFQIWDVVFVNLGEFFGILGSFAIQTPAQWLNWFSLFDPAMPDYYIPNFQYFYTNVFTGYIHLVEISSSSINTLVGQILDILGNTFFVFTRELPFFLALPISFATWGWVFALLKWLKDLVF